MAFVKCVALRVNCGYARTAIRELIPRGAKVINTTKRASEFRDVFQSEASVHCHHSMPESPDPGDIQDHSR